MPSKISRYEIALVITAISFAITALVQGARQTSLDRSRAYTLLGDSIMAAGRPALAMRYYETAAAQRVPYPYSFMNLGNRQMAESKWKEAAENLSRASAFFPADPTLFYYLGYSLMQVEAMDFASAAFRKSISLSPNNAAAHLNLGIVLLRTGNASEGANEIGQAARLDPSDPVAKSILENMAAGR